MKNATQERVSFRAAICVGICTRLDRQPIITRNPVGSRPVKHQVPLGLRISALCLN